MNSKIIEKISLSHKKKVRNKWIILIPIITIIAVALNIIFTYYSGFANIYLGKGKAIISQAENTENWPSIYYESDYTEYESLMDASNNLIEKIESEGIILLKNGGVLPLFNSEDTPVRVTLLGRNAGNSVYGGSGSGSVDLASVIDLYSALQEKGFILNKTAYDKITDYGSFVVRNRMGNISKIYKHQRANIVMDRPSFSSYYIGEMPVAEYSDETVSSFSEYDDAVIIVIGRGGGEGGDLTQNMRDFDDNYREGQHQLELNQDELELLELAKKHFDNIIVIINSSSAMELGVLQDDPLIDSILWIGSPGQTGFRAVADILDGTITPSGRTTDIYPRDFTLDPTFVNFGNFQYNNISVDNAIGSGYFVQYEEGLYFGYRYYETAAAEKFLDYKESVVYPFGYGLSYTSFSWKIESFKFENIQGKIFVSVKVTNTGSKYAGKDVVQLYYSPPYETGGIEKSVVTLGDFAKTQLLAPGESETIQLSFAVEDMASYDYKNEKAWILDEGEYVISLQSDSHSRKDGIDTLTYTVNKTVVYGGRNHRSTDLSEVTNRFDDVSAMFSDIPVEGKITNMTRSDFAATFPTTPKGKDFIANNAIIADFQPYNVEMNLDSDAAMTITDQESNLSLIDMRGRDFNDRAWEPFLNQITKDEIVTLIIDSAYNTAAIERLGKPATVELDGPAGISAFMGDTNGAAYPSEVVVGATFNTDLACEMGRMVGNEAIMLGVNGWYAPAVNLHRSPFAGRNFEYYSEDPYLSGKIAISVVEGAAEKGVYTFLKHFVLNDQETNRNNNGLATWANEQVLREIYLKPFEMVVKDAKTMINYIGNKNGDIVQKEMPAALGIMSSFNRIGSVWTGGSLELMDSVLRMEWGFTGAAISDFNLYPHMFVNQGLTAGTDFNITFASQKTIQDSESAVAVSYIRRSAHRILYMIANSNAMNGIVPGTTVRYTLAPWEVGLIIWNIISIIVIFISIYKIYVLHKRYLINKNFN